MDQQLTTTSKDAELVAVAPAAKPSMIQAVMAAAMNPDLDPDRIKAFLDMAREMDQDEKKQQFNAAFAAAHAQISSIHIAKNGEIIYPGKNNGPASVIKFIKHDDISRVIKPILAEHGLTATYSSEILVTPPKAVTVMTIIHSNGHSREWRSIPMPLVDSGGGKNDVQGSGSISTYGRRYVTIAAFDIVAEDADDDGNKGRLSQAITQEQADGIRDILNALEQHQKGSATAFNRWINQQFKVESVDQLLQGDQYEEVIYKLDTKQRSAGLKR
jgi:hypothetical protein